MNNIVSNFNQILDFAESYSMPLEKRRGILREYLQAKFISVLYTSPNANKLSFIGGTGLRLLRGLNRFSEDLDFDNSGLTNKEIEQLINQVTVRFKAENIAVELSSHIQEYKTYFELKFPDLLKDLSITSNPKENLLIKFDYSSFWRGQKTEAVLFNKYGFIESVITNNLNQVLVQKLGAYINRKTTQPRDLYDIVWLVSQGAKLDSVFAKENKVPNILKDAQDKFKKEQVPQGFKAKLEPFLFNSEDVRKLDLFGKVLESLK